MCRLPQWPPTWLARQITEQAAAGAEQCSTPLHCHSTQGAHNTSIKTATLAPIKQTISFKILNTVQKTYTPLPLQLISKICSMHKPRRMLRSSSDQWILEITRTSNQYGARSLKALGAKLWKDLPPNMRGPMEKTLFKGQKGLCCMLSFTDK